MTAPGETHTHYKRLFAHTRPLALSSHFRCTCSVPGCGGSALAEAVQRQMLVLLCLPAAVYLHPRLLRTGFSQIVFALDSVKHETEAFVNGRQLRRENGVLGTERQSRWRRGDVEEQVLILTDHAWLNHLSAFFSLSVLIFTAVAGAAPQAPSPTDPLRPPCTSPTTHRLLRQPRQPPLFPWPCPLTRITPTASRLPCSRLHTHTTPICLLLQQPCLHRHH